LNTLKN